MNSNARTRILIITAKSAPGAVPGMGESNDESARVTIDEAAGRSAEHADKASFQPAWSLAEELSAQHDVILAVPEKTGLSHRSFAVVYYNRRNIGLLANASEVVICGKDVLEAYPHLNETASPLKAGLNIVRSGNLDAVLAGGPPGGRDEPKQEKHFLYIWRTPSAQPGKGLRYYLARLRYHMQAGGVRRTASKGGSLIKRKTSGKGDLT